MPQTLSSAPEGASKAQLDEAIAKGCHVVRYPFVISLIFVSLQLNSGPHLVRPQESKIGPGWAFAFTSLLFGWWGIPWGPIYTVKSIWIALHGGEDITFEYGTAVEDRWWPACPKCGTKNDPDDEKRECTSCGGWLPAE